MIHFLKQNNLSQHFEYRNNKYNNTFDIWNTT